TRASARERRRRSECLLRMAEMLLQSKEARQGRIRRRAEPRAIPDAGCAQRSDAPTAGVPGGYGLKASSIARRIRRVMRRMNSATAKLHKEMRMVRAVTAAISTLVRLPLVRSTWSSQKNAANVHATAR